MSIISSALANIKKGSSAFDKNKVEEGLVKSYKKESAKKFVGGGSNTEVGIKSVSRNIKKTKVGKGVGYSNIVNQLNGILDTTNGIKNTLLTDYANEVKKNRAEKRIANAEKRREREGDLESKSSKKRKGFSVPGFISKPASSIFDWILNFLGMTILGSLVNLGLKNFDNIAKFFNDITGSGSGGGIGGGLKFGNLFWLIRAALYKLIIPKFFIKLALRGLGLLLSPLKLITAPFRLVGGLIFNTLKFVGNTLFNWTSKIVKLVTNIGRSVIPGLGRLGSAFRNLFPGSSKTTPGGSSRTGKTSKIRKTSPSGRSKGGSRIQKLHGHSAADLYENSYKNAIADGKSPTDAARRANADVKKALKKGKIVSKPQSSLAKIKGSNVFKRGFKPNRMILKIFGKGPAKFLASNAKVFSQFGKVFKASSGFAKRIPVIGPLMVAAVSMMSGDPIDATLFKTGFAALGGAIGSFIPIPIVGMVMGEMIGQFVGELLYQGFIGGDWGGAGKRLMNKLKELLQGGKEALEWVGGGFSRFYEALPKFKVPDFPKDPPGVLKDIPFLGGAWEKIKIALKVMLGPLSLLMGKELPDLRYFLDPNNWLGGPLLLKSFFPDGFVNTMKSAATSIFGMEGESENQFEGNGNNNFNDSRQSSLGFTKGGNSDFWTLVAVASREDSDPQGRADVAQAIYNRAASGAYGGGTNNIRKLILGKTQFEPTWTFPNGQKNGYGVPNDEWMNISDAQTAAAASGLSVSEMKNVAAQLRNPTLQKKARDFVGGRTDFTGYSKQAGKRKGQVQRKAGDNWFGWDWNYTGKVIGNPISTPDNSTQISPNPQSSGNSSSITGSSSRSSSPSSVSSYASYEKGGDDSNTIMVTLPNRYYQSGSESSSLPILAMDSKSILNSYYKSQFVGFLYKQG